MGISGLGYTQTYCFNQAAKSTEPKGRMPFQNEAEGAAIDELVPRSSKTGELGIGWNPEEWQKLMRNEFGVTDMVIDSRISTSDAIPNCKEGAPYSYLADESGVVEYNGVVFVCDNEKRALCLGDVSNSDNVIRIPLSNGGCLMVNRDNIGSLGKAIGMFSPEDVNLILRALKLDAKVQEMKKEIEDMEAGIGSNKNQLTQQQLDQLTEESMGYTPVREEENPQES